MRPLPYDMAWTTKLITRDIKDLGRKTKRSFNKNAKIFEKLFQSSKAPADKVVPTVVPKVEAPAPVLESAVSPVTSNAGTPITKNVSNNATPHHNRGQSLSTTITATEQTRYTSRPGSASTYITAVTSNEDETSTLAQGFYEWMEFKRDEWYKNRPRDIPHEERWAIRGIAIIICIALQNCPSNPIYDILRDGEQDNTTATFVTNLLQLASSKTYNEIVAALGQKDPRVCQLPSTPYERKQDRQELQYDSVLRKISASHSPGTAVSCAAGEPEVSPPAHLWHALVVALTDRSKTVSIVEGLLGLVCPDVDAHELLIRIGDPTRRLGPGEDDMLRHKFRKVLYPEYEALGMSIA
ncbi:hypothetical protein BDV95DRAFT_613208 [Massariosphaeria phaeospora]|uniref:Uncharacterized protein n=1 Tax=Massariosphaeria phaeospora TaxID=100035 RepID=A0A7C8HYA7_9PLEO|nr:hypothetical protein BDV95DRAFT_613208 [Massariosphaeria phaeospora]